MHKNVPKQSERAAKITKTVAKPTVFEQLDKLKRLLRASGIKVNINELLKGKKFSSLLHKCQVQTNFFSLTFVQLILLGSKTFQERCERIRDILYRNGIEGEPTMAKCKKLKKQLKLKEEIAGLDPNAIIESKEEEEGRPTRTTRRATRRNYVYDDADEAKKPLQPEIKEDTSQLLQKMKEFIDSDSEYEADVDDHGQNGAGKGDTVEPTNIVDTVNNSIDQNAPLQSIQTQAPDDSSHDLVQTTIDNSSASIECSISSDQV